MLKGQLLTYKIANHINLNPRELPGYYLLRHNQFNSMDRLVES